MFAAGLGSIEYGDGDDVYELSSPSGCVSVAGNSGSRGERGMGKQQQLV